MRRLTRGGWSNAVVLLAYSLLTILFTYPLAFQIGSALPGLAPDTYQYIWNLEWVKRALFDLGTNPFFTREIYYPTGVSLYYHTLILGNDLLTLPLQLAIGAAPAYMLATLAMFVLTGYGSYLLAFDLLRHRGAAFFVGMALALSPFHLSHLLYSHFNLMPLQWLPLFILAAKKLFDRPGARFLLLALVFLAWTSLTDWYYALYELLILGIYSLYRLWRTPARRVLIPAALLGVFYIFVMSPILVPMLDEASATPSDFRGAEETDRFSADFLSYFVPSSYQTFWGSAVAPLALKFHGGAAERTLFLGYTTIAFALAGIFLPFSRSAVVHVADASLLSASPLPSERQEDAGEWGRRSRPHSPASNAPSLLWGQGPGARGTLGLRAKAGQHEPYFWLVLALIFMLLSLGPRLYVAGTANLAQNVIHLPYELLMQVPGLSSFLAIARSIGRFGIMVMLCVCLLAGFGLKGILARISSRFRPWVLLAACGAVGVEFLTIPVITTPLQVPPSVEWLAAQPDNFATLDVPLSFPTGGEAMYFWTVTHKPTMNGYHSRLLPFPLFQGIASLRTLVHPQQSRDIVKTPNSTAVETLNFFDVRYIVLHKKTDMGADLTQSEQWIAANMPGVSPVSDDATLAVYPVPSAAPAPLLASLNWSGGEPEDFNGQIWRWMDNDAGATIYARQAITARLIFLARSLGNPRHLQVYLNDSLVHEEAVPSDDITEIQVSSLALHSGGNELRWHSIEPPQQPSAIGLNADPRWLSIAFSEVQVQVMGP